MVAIATNVVESLANLGLTLAVAESCTGGLIGSLLTDVPGSSRIFPGGVVAYGNQPKRELLGVPADLLVAHGAVSGEAAAAMAEGVRHAFGTDFGLGVTGITGPTGGSGEKPIGTVFIACASAEGVDIEHHQWTGDDDGQGESAVSLRERNKRKSAMAALALALRCATGGP